MAYQLLGCARMRLDVLEAIMEGCELAASWEDEELAIAAEREAKAMSGMPL